MSALREYPRTGWGTAAVRLRESEGDKFADRLDGYFHHKLGRAEVEECVDRAWMELYEAADVARANDGAFKAAWYRTAYRRCLNALESPRHARRELTPVEDYCEFQASPGVADLLEEGQREYRLQELLHSLSGAERKLAVAVIEAHAAVPKPRHLEQITGWPNRRVLYVRAKLADKLLDVTARRENGELCAERREVMGTYVEWLLSFPPDARISLPQPDDEELKAMWWHVRWCDSCLRELRALALTYVDVQHALAPPLGLVAAAIGAGKALFAGAKLKAATTLPNLSGARGRAAGAGGTSGAAGGLLSGFGGKVAACGVAAVCLGGAGTLVVGAGGPLVAKPGRAVPFRAPAPGVAAQSGAVPTAPVAAREQPPAVAGAEPSPSPRRRVQRQAVLRRDSSGTPGDLGLWMESVHRAPRASTATTRSAPSRDSSSSSSSGSQSCTPGDLGC